MGYTKIALPLLSRGGHGFSITAQRTTHGCNNGGVKEVDHTGGLSHYDGSLREPKGMDWDILRCTGYCNRDLSQILYLNMF